MCVERWFQCERSTFLKGKNQNLSSLPFFFSSEFLFLTVVLKVTVKRTLFAKKIAGNGMTHAERSAPIDTEAE